MLGDIFCCRRYRKGVDPTLRFRTLANPDKTLHEARDIRAGAPSLLGRWREYLQLPMLAIAEIRPHRSGRGIRARRLARSGSIRPGNDGFYGPRDAVRGLGERFDGNSCPRGGHRAQVHDSDGEENRRQADAVETAPEALHGGVKRIAALLRAAITVARPCIWKGEYGRREGQVELLVWLQPSTRAQKGCDSNGSCGRTGAIACFLGIGMPMTQL